MTCQLAGPSGVVTLQAAIEPEELSVAATKQLRRSTVVVDSYSGQFIASVICPARKQDHIRLAVIMNRERRSEGG